jgi:hypothetical protein
MYKLFFLFFMLPLASLCQSKADKVLTDTSMAVGLVGEDGFVGKSVGTYCLNGIDKYIKRGTAVLISGIENCKKSYSNDNSQFFEIIYNNQTYFIERDKLLTETSYYSKIENMSPELADSFRTNAQRLGQLLYEGNSKKVLRFLDGCKSKGLAILEWSFYDESEYTEGTSVSIKVYNPTQKTIKYLWFTFIGFNPVGDKVVDRRRGTNIAMKGVGPIKTDESGTYKYTYVWFTDLVETARITSIKIQYMDGSFKTVTNPKEIILPKELYDLLYDDE